MHRLICAFVVLVQRYVFAWLAQAFCHKVQKKVKLSKSYTVQENLKSCAIMLPDVHGCIVNFKCNLSQLSSSRTLTISNERLTNCISHNLFIIDEQNSKTLRNRVFECKLSPTLQSNRQHFATRDSVTSGFPFRFVN